MSDQELIYKVLEQVSTINARTAVMESKQDGHIKLHKDLVDDFKNLQKDHYNLKEEFKTHKNKFLLITGFIGALFGIISTFAKDLVINVFTKHN